MGGFRKRVSSIRRKCATRPAVYLKKPHLLVSELGETARKNSSKSARFLALMQSFVNRVQPSDLNAVKCLIYDGADADDFELMDEAAS